MDRSIQNRTIKKVRQQDRIRKQGTYIIKTHDRRRCKKAVTNKIYTGCLEMDGQNDEENEKMQYTQSKM